MIAVSDSTTLIILSNLSKLEYLQNIFKTVLIPSVVYDEISIKKTPLLPDFVKVVEVSKTELLESLLNLLDIGESQAIVLALQKGLPLVIDEKKGRKIAQNLNLKIIGLLGIVYLNIKKGHLNLGQAKKFLEDAKKSGYRVSQKLVDEMFNSL